MSQRDLFDRQEADAQKEAGLDKVEKNSERFVDVMRAYARVVARRPPWSVTSDDLRAYAHRCGLEPNHPNAWGAVFRGAEWKQVGWTKSRLVSNHSRAIRIWRLA